MSRIQLTDSTIDALVKMAEGNPGAIAAITDIMNSADDIDPQSAFGPMSAILMLDTWGIYSTDIYIIYNDKCNRDVRRMLMLFRATQLGLFSESKLQQMAADQRREINLTTEEWDDLDSQVCSQLKDFAPRPEPEVATA